ncbi:site-specific integrase [Pseudonocardiaceae bacterium YIM PH 21723]|nr:site-specific integrase [Pseudonocardiaceae bacterium YIM PH 21723]
MTLALVQDLRDHRTPPTPDELADFETDVLAGFVMARAAAGLADSSIRNDINNLGLIRQWFEQPLWAMQPADADLYFGKVTRTAKPSTRAKRAGSLSVYFDFLELRHAVELANLLGRAVECPLDEMNRPQATLDRSLRVPPSEAEMKQLFDGWREELSSCRKFAPMARNFTAARLAANVGLRINEVRMLDLHDVRWDLGTFGKLHVRHGKGSRRRGPKPRLAPLINGADRLLTWFIEDIWSAFGGDFTLPDAPLFPSERGRNGGHLCRASAEVYRRALAEATANHLPEWAGKLTPHVLRHYCASELYRGGMNLLAIQELLGHAWTGTTAGYIHVQGQHIEQAWLKGQQRAADRWKGLTS